MPIDVNYGVNLGGQQATASAASQRIATDAMSDLGESIGEFIREKRADRKMEKLLAKPDRELSDYQELAKYNPEAATAIYEMDQMSKKADAEQRASMLKKGRAEVNATGSIFGQLQSVPEQHREEMFINAVEQISQQGGEGAGEFVGELIDRSLSKDAKRAMQQAAKQYKKNGLEFDLEEQKKVLGHLMGGQKSPFDLSDESISLELGTLSMLATALEGQDYQNMKAGKGQQQQKPAAGGGTAVADYESRGYSHVDARAMADPKLIQTITGPGGNQILVNKLTGQPIQHPKNAPQGGGGAAPNKKRGVGSSKNLFK